MNRVEEIKEVIVRHLLTPHPDLPPQGGKEMNGYYTPVPSVGKGQPLMGEGWGEGERMVILQQCPSSPSP